MWNLQNVQRTVKDLYDWQQTHPTAGRPRYLLSDFTSVVDPVNDFWKDYKDNHLMYDFYFARRYKNFRYYGQDISGDNPVENVYFDFVDEINMFLRINDKKYSSLYKIQILNNIPTPTADYTIDESRTRSIEGEYVSGSRQDSGQNITGSASSTSTDSTKAFNSSNFVEVQKTENTTQPRTDTSSVTKGSQTDTEERSFTETSSVNGSKGNPSENIEKYKETWSSFSFYTMIFDDICKALLLV